MLLPSSPAAGFDEPYELLAACHDRVRRMLQLFERLAEHVAAHGLDTPARQAARDLMRYFDLAAPAHHDDEELHVFPLVEAQGTAAQQALVARLRADHAAMRADWPALRADLDALAGGQMPASGYGTYDARWRAYAARYVEHLAAEDGEVFPASRAWADEPRRRAMGADMAARRGVAPAGGRGGV